MGLSSKQQSCFSQLCIFVEYRYTVLNIASINANKLYVTCPNEMSCMSKKIKIELVTPLERRCINLSNGVKIMDISHTQPKLLDAEHA